MLKKLKKVKILHLKNKITTPIDNDTCLLYLDNYDYLPVVCKFVKGRLIVNFNTSKKYSDEEIYSEINRIIKQELNSIKEKDIASI